MCFIEFLNEYNGAFTVLLTLILVIINIYMGWQNHVLRRDATKPKVLAEICGIDSIVCYRFSNSGASPATNIQIKIDPYLIERMQGDPLANTLKRIAQGSFFLAPGNELLISTRTIWKEIKNHKLSLSYTYDDLSGKSYSQEYLFDLSIVDLDLSYRFPKK